MSEMDQGQIPLDPRYRVIKRYTNRKLYDTRDSRYVTLLQLADMIRDGEEVRVLDNATKEDKTEVTLALILSEELKSRPRALPLPTLEALMRHGGGRVLTQLRDSPVGRLAGPPITLPSCEDGPNRGEPDGSLGMTGQGVLATLEQWHQAVDERVRKVLPPPLTVAELEVRVGRLAERVSELERRMANRQARKE
ncbi:MAG: polyhydroxyalkanoate synthesis regulator DNA-binding domain-containing protein [Polyangiaceae bacterium]|nr:polyhydroxyalkanoate synthesis regulator DNA-binding domain-containing protein [Polyangiaceae bacterium]